MTITVHTLVKNEFRFVWYAVMSVVNHVDKVLMWDTGSTDGTLEIIKEIKGIKDIKGKIDFRQTGDVSPQEYTKVRQEMLEATETDWFILVDGDEIWWQDSIRHLVSEIKKNGDRLESIVVPTINLVGDIYHYQEEAAGQYELAGRRGHLSLRAVNRKIPGLHSEREHGIWGWADGKAKMIQNRNPAKIKFVDAPYLHATHLPRGAARMADAHVPKRAQKLKYELGIPFPLDFYYPEIFFRPRPDIVPSPWEKMTTPFKIRAALETPLRRIKRRVLPTRVGY